MNLTPAKKPQEISLRDNQIKTLLYKTIVIILSQEAVCHTCYTENNRIWSSAFSNADVFGWPTPQCSYPKWIARTIWRDLSGRHLYETLKEDRTTIRLSFRQLMTSHPEVMKSFRCYRVLENNSTDDQHVAISFVSHGWWVKFSCSV